LTLLHSLSGFQGASRSSCEYAITSGIFGCRQRQAATPVNACCNNTHSAVGNGKPQLL